jgi:hypothetical protein
MGDYLDRLLDLELEMIKTFQWSLHEIDQTDCVSLFQLFKKISGSDSPKLVYADQADGW